MKKVVFGAILLAASSAMASGDQFLGSYHLTKSEVTGKTFCYDSFSIQQTEDGLVAFSVDGYNLYAGEVNGAKRKVSFSHGEALSTTKGYDQVALEKGVLSFQFKGTESFIGVPSTRVESTVSMKLSNDGKTLTLIRKEFSGVAFGIGKTAKALCEYTR